MDKFKAKEFVERWSGRGNENQETQLFWIELLQEVLGCEKALDILKFEVPIITPRSETPGYADVVIPSSRVLIEQKSLNIDLDKPELRQDEKITPFEQALGYMAGFSVGRQPYYLITCNFKQMRIYDTRKHDSLYHNPKPDIVIDLEDIPNNLGTLQFLVGNNQDKLVEAKQVSIEAGQIMGKIHDAVAAQFEDPDSEVSHHALSVFCTRIMFLMFCEDAGLIGPNVFTNYIEHYDPRDTRDALLSLFKWLDTPDSERSPYANELLRDFPYMNGGLFRERTEIPIITKNIHTAIYVHGCKEFDWSDVDPTVFGSIFEGALSHDERRSGGMHYTSPENIHKVIDPLFLDDLKDEFNEIKSRPRGRGRTRSLNVFHKKLGDLVFLDPAAGSGNFLTETYKCLRELENQVLYELARDGQASLEFEELDEVENSVLVTLKNFHGIEINDFACCVARTALWIAEKQADIKTEYIIKRVYQALPLKDYEGIIHANSLRIDWNDVVPANEVDYIMGNPPFIGHQMRSEEQKADVKNIFSEVRGAGKLDYVACWFKKAADFMIGYAINCAFVSTNSICQGESVGILWRWLFEHGININFAWRDFVWDAEVDEKAHVHVVIIGFSRGYINPCKLWDRNGDLHTCRNINGYLYSSSNVFIENRGTSKNELAPKMTKGSQPTDGGNLILSLEEKNELIEKEPKLASIIRPYVGAKEFIDGRCRYCLWFDGQQISDYMFDDIRKRLMNVKEMRLKSPTKSVNKAAETPWLFTQIRQPKSSYIALPETSSERRKYLPIGYLEPEIIASNALRFLPSDSMYIFGLLNSQFHNAWMRVVAGRLEMRYRYSPAVYNSFIFPSANKAIQNKIIKAAESIIAAREKYTGKSLADLYDPDNEVFFPELFNAHAALDRAVEEAYGVDFNGDEEKIVAHLFKLYEEKTQGK